MIRTPFAVEFGFACEMPKSWSKKKREEMAGQPHAQTPDLSNYIKFIEDALNSFMWEDDRLITEIRAQKIWSFSPKTEIRVNLL